MVKSGLIPDESSTPHHFFIPILSTPASTQPFCIPKAFLKYLQVGKKKINKTKCDKKGEGEVLEAILRSNGRGKSFAVNMIMGKDGRLMSGHVKQEDDEDVKGRGWNDFSDYHDLHVGDFLLFRHLGSLSFDVIVFDSTTCQRKYPSMDPPFFFFDHMNTGKSPMLSKKTTTPYHAKQEDTDGAAFGSSNDDDTPLNQFTTPLKHYNFSDWKMHFPMKFVRSNGLGKNPCWITFRYEKGRPWPLKLCKKSTGQVYVRGGWRQFIEGNDLKEGDVCTFKLVSRRGGIVFDVSRGSKTSTPDQAKRGHSNATTEADSSNENASTNKFTTCLRYYNFSQWAMTIPAKFVRSNGLGKQTCMITFRDETGRSWPITMGHKGGGQIYVHGGWRQFIKGNDLKEGDVCTFELVSQPGRTKKIVFDVHRGSKTTIPDQAKREDTDADGAAAAGRSNKGTQSNKFTISLKYYHFSQRRMIIPMAFVRSHGLGNENCMITFRDEKGKSWPIGLRYKKRRSEVYVNGGWHQFIKGNGLKQGEVCTFELVSRRGGTKNIIFDVRKGHH